MVHRPRQTEEPLKRGIHYPLVLHMVGEKDKQSLYIPFFPTIATLCGLQCLNNNFVALTFTKLKLGKVWLVTKKPLSLAIVVATKCG